VEQQHGQRRDGRVGQEDDLQRGQRADAARGGRGAGGGGVGRLDGAGPGPGPGGTSGGRGRRVEQEDDGGVDAARQVGEADQARVRRRVLRPVEIAGREEDEAEMWLARAAGTGGCVRGRGW